MDTLRGFVRAVWSTDPSLRRPKVPATVWSKPDIISGDLELRRMTTAENKEYRRTDFFEFYWAHLMRDTGWDHVRAWLGVLLFRSPRRVPPQLRGIWWMVVCLLASAGVVGLAQLFEPLRFPPPLLNTLGAIWLVVGGAISALVLRVAGDAARYLHVAPTNIEVRRHIRQSGLELLDRLHASGAYDRIIVVGHSLGSVIGHDILSHHWARCHDATPPGRENSPEELEALAHLERLATAARADPSSFDPDEYQRHQTAYWTALRARGHPWLVSDFVTLGSPLAHASCLVARDEKELRRKIEERELPSCPPALETVGGRLRFSYENKKLSVPHHAAVFAPTRWTNLFFPCRHTFRGDFIGGPVAPAFGPGVKDIPVRTDLRHGLFSHTLYWDMPPESAPGEASPSWILRLREAVRILRQPPAPPPSSPPPAPVSP